MPKMHHHIKSNDSRAANHSHLNIESSVLDKNHLPNSVARKNSDHPIKIPSCSSKEQVLEYLTDGSAGTENNPKMRQTQQIGLDKVRQVMNKSAYMKKNSLKHQARESNSSQRLLDDHLKRMRLK